MLKISGTDKNISQLVVFGDSWSYGAELELTQNATNSGCIDTYRLNNSFAGIISKHYDITLQNYALQGSSLQAMIWEFESWVEKNYLLEESLVLFGLTWPSRQTWWNNLEKKYEHSILLDRYQDSQNEFFQLNKIWSANSMGDWLEAKQYQTAVYIFSGMCERLKIPCVQFDIFPKNFKVAFDTVINDDEPIVKMLRRIQQEHPTQKLTYLHHPSELGHLYIAQYLIDVIDKKFLI